MFKVDPRLFKGAGAYHGLDPALDQRAVSDRGSPDAAEQRGFSVAAAALATNGEESLAGLRDAAILAVASDALLRVSELAALTVADIDMTEQTITVQRSKTDQEGTGAVLFLGKPTVQRVQAWLEHFQ